MGWKFLDWLRRAREWRHGHIEAWTASLSRDADGFSAFQRNCEAAITEALQGRGQQLPWQTRRMSHDEPFLYCQLLDRGIELWIYTDTAEVKSLHTHEVMEEWDFLSPTDLITRFVEATMELVP
jgi:hypothetical protein